MKLVVTGASGFLGRELLRQALETGISVTALSSRPDRLREMFGQAEKLSSLGREALAEGLVSFEEDDVLINCAFPRTNDDSQMAGGLAYVEEVLRCAVKCGAKALINISSQSVYDQKRCYAATEDSPLLLQSNYAVGKYASELFMKLLEKDAHVTNVRMASLIGPGFDQRLTNKMAKSAIQDRKISYQINDLVFGFLDVEDAARAILRLAAVPAARWKTVYNLGSDASYALREIACTIAEILEAEHGMPVALASSVSEGSGGTMLCSERLKEEIGPYQQLSLRESLRRIVDRALQPR